MRFATCFDTLLLVLKLYSPICNFNIILFLHFPQQRVYEETQAKGPGVTLQTVQITAPLSHSSHPKLQHLKPFQIRTCQGFLLLIFIQRTPLKYIYALYFVLYFCSLRSPRPSFVFPPSQCFPWLGHIRMDSWVWWWITSKVSCKVTVQKRTKYDISSNKLGIFLLRMSLFFYWIRIVRLILI